MKNDISKFIAGALLVVGLAAGTNAQAGFVDFTFDGGNDATLGNPVVFGTAGYQVTAQGFYQSSPGSGSWLSTNTQVARGANALGVNRPGTAESGNQLDSSGTQVDGLLFDFGDVSWPSLRITFSVPATFARWVVSVSAEDLVEGDRAVLIQFRYRIQYD